MFTILLYATIALLLGGGWLRATVTGIARYLWIGYGISAAIILTLTLLYTWDKVLHLVLFLLGKLPKTEKWECRGAKWSNSLIQLNAQAGQVLLVPASSIACICINVGKLFILYSIPYLSLRLLGIDALSFWQVQLLSSVMLLITSALPNVAGVGPMEFAFLLMFSGYVGSIGAASALVLYRMASYFAPLLYGAFTFWRIQKRVLHAHESPSAPEKEA